MNFNCEQRLHCPHRYFYFKYVGIRLYARMKTTFCFPRCRNGWKLTSQVDVGGCFCAKFWVKLIHSCSKTDYKPICFLPVAKVANMYMTSWYCCQKLSSVCDTIWEMECYGVFKGCVVKCICTGGKIKVAWETLILAFPDFWMLFCATFSLPQSGACTVFYLYAHSIN